MVPGNSGQLQAVQMQTTSASAQQTQTTVASEEEILPWNKGIKIEARSMAEEP